MVDVQCLLELSQIRALREGCLIRLFFRVLLLTCNSHLMQQKKKAIGHNNFKLLFALLRWIYIKYSVAHIQF